MVALLCLVAFLAGAQAATLAWTFLVLAGHRRQAVEKAAQP